MSDASKLAPAYPDPALAQRIKLNLLRDDFLALLREIDGTPANEPLLSPSLRQAEINLWQAAMWARDAIAPPRGAR